jgi:hypothetical protein
MVTAKLVKKVAPGQTLLSKNTTLEKLACLVKNKNQLNATKINIALAQKYKITKSTKKMNVIRQLKVRKLPSSVLACIPNNQAEDRKKSCKKDL